MAVALLKQTIAWAAVRKPIQLQKKQKIPREPIIREIVRSMTRDRRAKITLSMHVSLASRALRDRY
jgi:hypothetical protein